LDRVWQHYHPRRLLIEASGVADPKTLLPVLQEAAFKNKFTLKKTITVLDADYWEARDVFGPLFYHQLETADLILLNKIDRIDPEKVPLFMQQIHECIGDCPVLPAYHCGVDPEALFSSSPPKAFAIPPIQFYRAPWAGSPQAPPLGRSPAGAPGNETQRHTGDTPVSAAGFVTFSFTASTPLDETRFKRFLHRLPWEVFRVKGPVRFPDRLEMLNFVGNKAEWTPWAGKPETRLAFIGWGVEGSAIIEKLKKCLGPTE
jgi:G3E family GTPase